MKDDPPPDKTINNKTLLVDILRDSNSLFSRRFYFGGVSPIY
jgi:hypothetical protein